jgi:hypothetical protein
MARYSVLSSVGLVSVVAFANVISLSSPDNFKLYVEYALTFAAICAPIGGISGVMAGLAVLVPLRPRKRRPDGSNWDPLKVGVWLVVGSLPGFVFGLWFSTIFALDSTAMVARVWWQLALAVLVLAACGSLYFRSLARNHENRR